MENCSSCNITYSECEEFSSERVHEFLVTHGNLTDSLKCPRCNHTVERNVFGTAFHCTNNRSYNKESEGTCSYKKSYKSGTFFHLLNLPDDTVFKLVGAVLCLYPAQRKAIIQETGVAERHIVDWMLVLREVFIDSVSFNSNKLGGENKIVELVEGKWKIDNLEGGLCDWVFGGIEHPSGETFLDSVGRHNFESIKKTISEKINPGTIIVTNCTNNLTTKEINDLKENLKVSFVLPADSTISEVIKQHWSEVRKGFINLSSKRPLYSIDQMAEYLFKSKHPVIAERIHAFFVAAGSLYPPVKEFDEFDY